MTYALCIVYDKCPFRSPFLLFCLSIAVSPVTPKYSGLEQQSWSLTFSVVRELRSTVAGGSGSGSPMKLSSRSMELKELGTDRILR